MVRLTEPFTAAGRGGFRNTAQPRILKRFYKADLATNLRDDRFRKIVRSVILCFSVDKTGLITSLTGRDTETSKVYVKTQE